MKTPAISVLMPVYNAERYLAEAIESVLNQSFTDFELIIINDGSTDSSKEIILSYSDERIQYVENEKNLGLVNTLNKGIDLCSGKYIARMDSDDSCHPDRFKEQLSYMERHPDVGVCGTWVNVINSKGQKTSRVVNQTKPELIKIHLLFSVPIIHPSTLIKTELLKGNKYHHMIGTEDYDLWCRLSKQTKLVNIPSYLLQYRWHDNNVSKENEPAKLASKQITVNQLNKLGIKPTNEDYRIHKLSFTLYSFHGEGIRSASLADLNTTASWFKTLLAANKKAGIYNQQYFKAYLWSRWIVLCVALKKKGRIFFPSFVSYHPKILFLLAQQVLLLTKKKV